jgi:hypothetical protein
VVVVGQVNEQRRPAAKSGGAGTHVSAPDKRNSHDDQGGHTIAVTCGIARASELETSDVIVLYDTAQAGAFGDPTQRRLKCAAISTSGAVAKLITTRRVIR